MSPSSGKSVSSDQELGLTSKQSEPATDFRKCESISTASDMSNIQKRIGKESFRHDLFGEDLADVL